MLTTLLHAKHLQPRWRALLCALLVAVCWLAFTPQPPELIHFNNADKLQHIAAFACLTSCTALSMAAGWRQAAWAAAAMFGYGVFIELVQTAIPGRTGEWQDLVADGIGIGIGMAAIHAARRWRPAPH